MLQWDAGLKSYDGIWAYTGTHQSKHQQVLNKITKNEEFSNTVLNFAAMAEDSYHELLTYKI